LIDSQVITKEIHNFGFLPLISKIVLAMMVILPVLGEPFAASAGQGVLELDGGNAVLLERTHQQRSGIEIPIRDRTVEGGQFRNKGGDEFSAGFSEPVVRSSLGGEMVKTPIREPSTEEGTKKNPNLSRDEADDEDEGFQWYYLMYLVPFIVFLMHLPAMEEEEKRRLKRL